MKEIKYITHLSRNIFIYFFIFLANSLLFNTTISIKTFFAGLVAYFLAYSFVYFLNDFADHKEDKKYNKSNLYLAFKNKKLFWTFGLILFGTGLILSYLIAKLSIIFLLILYAMNIAYSYPPLRIRDKAIFRESLIFFLNFVKSWLILLYLHQQIINFPLPIIALGASAMAFGQTFYKRYLGGNKVAETVFGIIFIISWVWTIVSYKQVFWLYFPLVPLLLFVGIKYKSKQVPLGIFQNIYFLYSIFIYILHLYS